RRCGSSISRAARPRIESICRVSSPEPRSIGATRLPPSSTRAFAASLPRSSRARSIAALLERSRTRASLAGQANVATVVLSGGVMQNDLLLGDVRNAISDPSIRLWVNHTVPANDGSVSLGQAALAACRSVRTENWLRTENAELRFSRISSEFSVQAAFCRGRDVGSPDAPRTEPYVQDCCIRLLPWMHSVEPHVRMRMQDLGAWNPAIHQLPEPVLGHPAPLTPSPERAVPSPDH